MRLQTKAQLPLLNLCYVCIKTCVCEKVCCSISIKNKSSNFALSIIISRNNKNHSIEVTFDLTTVVCSNTCFSQPSLLVYGNVRFTNFHVHLNMKFYNNLFIVTLLMLPSCETENRDIFVISEDCKCDLNKAEGHVHHQKSQDCQQFWREKIDIPTA